MTIRISGFNTGLDIDQIVKELMTARRQPLNKLNQQKTLLEWKREQYREISTKIVDFRNNKLLNYSMSNSIAAKKAIVTGDQSAVSVKAGSSAVTGESLTIKVNSLAEAGTVISKAEGLDASKTFKELFGLNDNTNISLKINGATITLTENDTIESMIQQINSKSDDARVSAYLDSQTGKFSLRAKSVGADSTIVIDDPDDFLQNFNIENRAGKDASVTINGIQTTRSDNTFTENGMEITLHAVSNAESTIRIATDTDKIVDMVKSFISDYNSILDTVNKKLNEERFRNYQPLTSEQKEELTEKEIELWETKAKSGLLRNDSILSTMINDFRLAIITDVEVNGVNVNLAQYGIGTGDWSQRGKLVIVDEEKLRAKIEEDPDTFLMLFTQTSSDSDPEIAQSATAADSGLFRRLSHTMMRALDRLAEKAGINRFSTELDSAFSDSSLIGEELRALNNRIKDLNARLLIIENNYFKQFTAMEVAINRFNTQAAALFGFGQ